MGLDLVHLSTRRDHVQFSIGPDEVLALDYEITFYEHPRLQWMGTHFT
jgi:hypothetical protein